MKENPHPFIVEAIDDFTDNGHQCIVEKFYPEGDFSKFLFERHQKYFQEKEILHFLANIIIPVYFLNSKDIYHRDLKPQNFLVAKE